MKNTLLIIIGLIIISDNTMAQWLQFSTGLPLAPVYCFANNTQNLFAGTYYGLYKTTNSDTSWEFIPIDTILVFPITALVVKDSNIYVGTSTYPEKGIYYSSNSGQTWTQINSGLPNNISINSLVLNGTNLYASGSSGINNYGIYQSTNNGQSWFPINSGLPVNTYVNTIAVKDSNIFVGIRTNSNGFNGIYLSANNGTSWLPFDTSYAYNPINTIFIKDSKVYCGTQNDKTIIYTYNGINWSTYINYDFYSKVVAFADIDSNIFAAGNVFENWADVFLTTNNDSTWNSTGLTGVGELISMIIYDSYIYVGTDRDIWRSTLSDLVNIIDTKKSDNISIYPNPVVNELIIEKNDSPLKLDIEIINSVGQIIYTSTFDKKNIINTSNFSKGVYLLKINSVQKNTTKKFMKL